MSHIRSFSRRGITKGRMLWALQAGHGLLTHFEVSGLQCRACEQSGEDHVQRDRKASTNVPISDLNILNLCGITCIAFCTPWGKRKTPQGQDTMTPERTGQQTFQCQQHQNITHGSSLFSRARPSLPATAHSSDITTTGSGLGT